jgi:hypothetical protein
MWNKNLKLDRANIVGGFNNQDDSEEALLGLRMAGFSDDRIGYYYPSGKDQMRDHLANDHRFAASIIGGIIGAGLGWLFARWSHLVLQDIDPIGLAFACGVCGALMFGMAGGMIGIWSARTAPFAPVQINANETFVLTVDAGVARDEARAIIELHGGPELPSSVPSAGLDRVLVEVQHPR